MVVVVVVVIYKKPTYISMIKCIFTLEIRNPLQVQFSLELQMLLELLCKYPRAGFLFLKILGAYLVIQLHLFHFMGYVLAHLPVYNEIKVYFTSATRYIVVILDSY